MRTSLVAGNWKMNKTVAEARELLSLMSPRLREIPNVEKVVCPSFLAIPALSEMLAGSGSRAASPAAGITGALTEREMQRSALDVSHDLVLLAGG